MIPNLSAMSACGNGAQKRHVVNGRCIHFESREMSWFQSRDVCIAEGGELVALDNAAVHAGIAALLDDVYLSRAPYWVGAVARLWSWPNGK